MFVLDAIFCGKNFCLYQDVVWLVKSSWCVSCCSIHHFYWVSDRCRSKRTCAVVIFLSEKSCCNSSGSFSFFLVLTIRHSLSFHKFEKFRAAFLGLILRFLPVDVTWECLIVDFSFFIGIMSFYVRISDAVFLVTSFSIFDHSVWLIPSFRCALFYWFIQFYWGSRRYTSEFALVSFCLNRVITGW